MRVLCAAIMWCVAVPHLHSQATEPSHQPPGRLVDIGGRKLHLNCGGSGRPAVILEAGGDAYAIDWALAQPRIALQTRVCSMTVLGLAGAILDRPTKQSNRPALISIPFS